MERVVATRAEPTVVGSNDAERSPHGEAREETIAVRGEPQPVMAEVSVCPACGQDLADALRDDRTLASAYHAYRQRHGLLRPGDTRRLRDRYGLSQRVMALLLGLDPWTYVKILDSRKWGMHGLGGVHGDRRLLGRPVPQGAGQALPVVEDLDVRKEGRPRLRPGPEMAQVDPLLLQPTVPGLDTRLFPQWPCRLMLAVRP